MWNKIIGQERVKEKIRTIYKSGKISHAFLFYGMDGVGKDAVAIEFAKLLNCSNIQDEQSCDECVNCKKISAFRSDYFHFVCALPAGKSEQTDSSPLEYLSAADYESYIEEVKLKSRNPYHQVKIPGANNIRINSIRDLINTIYLTVPGGGRFKKVFLISEAEKMKQEAANALLKVLEEPPRNSVIIMTTSKPHVLPPTIVGRCQRISFDVLMPEEIESNLSKFVHEDDSSEDYSKAEISLACKLSQGSYSRAHEMLKHGVKELRETMLNFLIAIVKNDFAELVRICREVSAKNNKDKTRYFLFQLASWFKDLVRVKYAFSQDNFSEKILANVDIKERLIRFSNNYPDIDFFNIVSSLEEAERLMMQNVQIQLILIDLSFKLRTYLRLQNNHL